MEKVRWGVLGTAGIARGQTIPGMQLADNCELYAVAGRDADKASRFQREFGFEKAYGSYEALLADPRVEAVYIPLPNHLHCEWAVKAMRAGKHVLCEKPMAVSRAQAEEMFFEADRNGVVLMEAYAYLHSPWIRAVREELDGGAIGEIRYLESAFFTGSRPDTDIRMRKETYGGALYDLGCYAVSMALRMTGKEPEEIRAMAQFSPCGIDLVTSALLIYSDGAVASLGCGFQLPSGRLDRFRIHGTRGTIESPVQFNQCGPIPYSIIRDGETVTRTVSAGNNYSLEVAQLGRCIRLGEQPLVSGDFSLKVAGIMDRILAAVGY